MSWQLQALPMLACCLVRQLLLPVARKCDSRAWFVAGGTWNHTSDRRRLSRRQLCKLRADLQGRPRQQRGPQLPFAEQNVTFIQLGRTGNSRSSLVAYLQINSSNTQEGNQRRLVVATRVASLKGQLLHSVGALIYPPVSIFLRLTVQHSN